MHGALVRLLLAVGGLEALLAEKPWQYRVAGRVGLTVENRTAFYNSSQATVAVAHGVAKSIGLAAWNDAEATCIDEASSQQSSPARVDVAYAFLTLEVHVVDLSSSTALDLTSAGQAINEELAKVQAPHVAIISLSRNHTDGAEASKTCEAYCKRKDQCSGMAFSCGDCPFCRPGYQPPPEARPRPSSEGEAAAEAEIPEAAGGSAAVVEPVEKDTATSIVEVFILILLFICLCFTGAASLFCYFALIQLTRRARLERGPPHWRGTKPGLRRQRGWDHRYPMYWSSLSVGGEQKLEKESDDVVMAVQALMDRTWKPRVTRDRKSSGGQLAQLRVHAVHRNENAALWIKYYHQRAEIAKATRWWRPDPKMARNIKATTMDLTNPIIKRADMVDEANEFYLFHGSSPAAVKNICQEDFKLAKSGTHRGSLYGHGLYFAESSSKSDEYSSTTPDTEDPVADSSLFTMLLCRVVCGRILYTDKEVPDVKSLTSSCTRDGGEHHSVLGDREKCRGTYREFVVYEPSQVYPEYIVVYRRRQGLVATE